MANEEYGKNVIENTEIANEYAKQKKESETPIMTDIEVPEVSFDVNNLEISVEDKDEIMKKRANKILDGEIVDFKIGKLRDLKKKLNEKEKQFADHYYIQIWVKTLNAPEKCGTENWTFPDYSKIDSLIKYKRLNNQTKLYKIIKRYIGTGKIKIEQLKGIKVQVKTNENGYASILV